MTDKECLETLSAMIDEYIKVTKRKTAKDVFEATLHYLGYVRSDIKDNGNLISYLKEKYGVEL